VRAARPRSWLASATLAAALIATGVAVGLDRADAVDVSSAKAVSIALGVLGLGLVVGGFAGRARSLILPAVVLVPLVATLGTLDHVGLDPFRSLGDRSYRVDGLADPDLRSAYHVGTGELRLDLSRFDPAGSTVAVRADVAVGPLRVWVPEDVEVAVHGQVAGGEITVLDDEHEGRGLDERYLVPGTAGRGTIDLDLEVGFGVVRVMRGSPDFVGRIDVPAKPGVPVPPNPVPATAPTAPSAPTAPTAQTATPATTVTTATTATTVPASTSEGAR
jgi:hypothetical protein